jgi:hypothetical protein
MRRNLRLLAVLALTLPILACTISVLPAWGDLQATAQAIWASIWASPEPDYYAFSIFCSESLTAAYGNPPKTYVDDIALTTQEIADAWGVGLPYSTTFTLGAPYPKPDGSGRIVVPLQFANPGGAYGVAPGGPVTGLCLEFEETDADADGTPVPLLAGGYQVGDWVLPTTTPQLGYAECASGITPTPLATDTPTPAPGDAYEPDHPDPPYHSSIAVGESQGRSLDPYGDEEYVHLWVWPGLNVRVRTHSLGASASTNLQVTTCSGTYADTDGGEANVSWLSSCPEIVVIHVWSSNGYFGPGETYILEVEPW